MNFAHFLHVEQETGGKPRHFVIHTRDPKFSVELIPDRDASDRRTRGVIKRLCVPNSCFGDYGSCSKYLSQALEFFEQSFNDPESSRQRRCDQA